VEQTEDIESPGTQTDQPQEEHERFRDTTEKIWDSTKSAWSTAAFKAGQYKRLVQKKIDLSALHKKIGASHADLGKLIDDLREAGQKSILTQPEIKEIFQNIDSLKASAAALEEEIENIKEEAPGSAHHKPESTE
jgi:chromosome segregation ATPase